MRGRDGFDRIKGFLLFLSNLIKMLPFNIRVICFNHARNIQGKKGLAIRYLILMTLAKKCGDNVTIHPNVFLFNVQKLSLGNNISIHPMCYIDATGGINIGNDVSIANGTTIMSTTHTYQDLIIPIKDQIVEKKQVIIYDNVWIGARVTILAGINIHSGVIVGANSVVTKNI